MLTRIGGALRSRALGAAVAQVGQAVGSFGLQIVAAWTLGASGLGTISLSLGIIVLTTALASGMVGDSLVILDRGDPKIRGALQGWAVLLLGASSVIAGIAMALTLLSPAEALLFAAALAAFQCEELIRRLHMGLMRFWRIVIMDAVAVGTALAIIALTVLGDGATIGSFFLALLVGQVAGIAVGIALLPQHERYWAPLRGSAFTMVGAFGSWRGAQVAVPQLMLTSSRVLVTAFAGAAVLGLIEGARLLVAPIQLTIQGLGSYLLSGYVRDKQLGVVQLHRRAVRASLAMMGAALVAGILPVAFAEPLGRLVVGSEITIDPWTAAGWVLYVVAAASFQPFTSLAAVVGQQRKIFLCRLVDAGIAMAALTALLAAGVSAAWMPFVLAAGLFLGGALVRAVVLAPLLTTARAARAAEPRMHHV